MNPKTPPPYTSQPYTNGHYETPLESSGVSLRHPDQNHLSTTFAAELPLRGWGPLLYALNRFHLVAIPLARIVVVLLLFIALIAGLGILPGQWLTAALTLILCGGLIALNLYFRRKQYVVFTPMSPPMPNATPLQTNEKLPIFATGLLSVDGRYRRFSALPGFYRTFGTSEHALLCRVQERSWFGLLAWPADETGMWYAFISPSEIQHLTLGILDFGPTSLPAIAVEYLLQLPPGQRRKRAEIRTERLYIAAQQLDDAKRLYDDLHNNLAADKIPTPLSAQR